MRGLTLHIESSDFIEKLVNDNPDLNIVIRDALIDKIIKRLVQKDYMMLKLENDTRKIVKSELERASDGTIKVEIRDKIKKEVENTIDQVVFETLSSVYEDRLIPILDETIEKNKKELNNFNIEEQVKKEIEKQVKEKLEKFWKN